MQPRLLSFGVALVVGLLLDQGTKEWVVRNVAHQRDEIDLIPGFLSIVHAHNTGAAFSMMEGMHYLFLAFTVVALLVVGDMLRRMPPQAGFQPAILGLLLSGALGNAIDRLRFGHVTDFIKVFWDQQPGKAWLIDQFGTNVWPIFNVADSSLLVGVAIYLIHSMVIGDPEPAPEPGEPAASPSA